MKGLPRAIIKKYGVTKKAWQVYRGEKHSAGKKVMAKRRSSPRRRWRWLKYKRRKRDNRFPLLVGGAAISTAVLQPIMGTPEHYGAIAHYNGMGRNNPLDFAQGYLDTLMINFTGYNTSGRSEYGFQAPLRTYTTLALALIGSELASRFGVNRTIKKIPLVGKYIKL